MPLGTDRVVNQFVQDEQTFPSIAVDRDGTFVVVWGRSGTSNDVAGRRFGPAGVATGGQFAVNVDPLTARVAPAVSFTRSFESGPSEFVVVWDTLGLPRDVLGRHFR